MAIRDAEIFYPETLKLKTEFDRPSGSMRTSL